MASKVKYVAKRQRGGKDDISKKKAKGSISACFQNEAAKKRFDDQFATRAVKKTWVIDYKFFYKCNFSFISTFDEFGWSKFLQLNYPVHENLIRAFYSNAICVELDDVVNINYVHEIITFVMGKTIVVN